jgi:NAD(P)-dependent dehydrogenase (short-subunit alcohol dehydrogenase family)
MSERLQGKISLVTGAARGIGRATALRLASEGSRVVVNDIDAEGAEAVTAVIEKAGGRALALPADVTDLAQVEGLFASAHDQCGPLDVLVNNAGGDTPTAMADCGPERYAAVLGLNLHAVWNCCQAALRQMAPRRRGAIVSISSGAGLGASEGLAAYGAAKAGVISLMRNIAQEYGPLGIRANSISPGPIASPGMLNWLDTLPGGAESWGEHIPTRRLGEPEEIANAVLFLASDEASYVNGAMLPVDGGVSSVLAAPPV